MALGSEAFGSEGPLGSFDIERLIPAVIEAGRLTLVERERGLDFQEDLFQPCVLRWELAVGGSAVVIAGTEPRAASDAPSLASIAAIFLSSSGSGVATGVTTSGSASERDSIGRSASDG